MGEEDEKEKGRLRLHDTLSREKRVFRPLDPERVRMYVCGPTVYDFAHVGNARPAIVFDVLFRLLRHLYGEARVVYVRNITDVDDKINARAAEEHPGVPLNEAIRRVTEVTERQYHEDVAALACLPPTHEPRATEHIEGMRAIIEALIARGHAYVAEDHALFDVASMPDYGALSKRRLDELEAGARVEVEAYKRGPHDFVLWKPSEEGEPGWPSPAGIPRPGRPGWHIECSAMAEHFLGRTFDIHGGGLDLIFPHHENEIAQSRCAHGTPFLAQVWMHNEFLMVEGAKMSKSLGNFWTIRDVLKDWPGEAVRLAMLMTHYRKPIDLTLGKLEEARRLLDRWYRLKEHSRPGPDGAAGAVDACVLDPLLDDLNTPEAIAGLHALAERAADDEEGDEHRRFAASAGLLGLLGATPEDWAAWRPASFALPEERIAERIAARAAARRRRDFAEADRIRAELEEAGVRLMDAKDKATGELVTTWEVKR